MVINWITVVASLLMMTLAMVLAILGKPTEMGIIVSAGTICIAFLNIDRIQKFKGAGFEAEMRQAVQEVHATIDQLRMLAAASAESSLTTLMAGNFMGSMTLSTRVDLRDRLIKNLNDIGVPKHDIDDAEAMWKRGVGLTYHRGIRYVLEGRKQKSQLNADATPEVLDASREFENLAHFDTWQAPSSAVMREFINERGFMTPDLDNLLLDYAYYEKSGEIARREVFVFL